MHKLHDIQIWHYHNGTNLLRFKEDSWLPGNPYALRSGKHVGWLQIVTSPSAPQVQSPVSSLAWQETYGSLPPTPFPISSGSYRSSAPDCSPWLLFPPSSSPLTPTGHSEETGRLAADLHLSLDSSRTIPLSHPQFCSRPSAGTSHPPSPVDSTRRPLLTSPPQLIPLSQAPSLEHTTPNTQATPARETGRRTAIFTSPWAPPDLISLSPCQLCCSLPSPCPHLQCIAQIFSSKFPSPHPLLCPSPQL